MIFGGLPATKGWSINAEICRDFKDFVAIAMNNSTFVEQTRAMQATLADILSPTPLQLNRYLSDRFGANIWLKREDLSPVRSYKIRGAYSFFHQHLNENPNIENFVCASAGNHAQGFAHACKHFDKSGWVFMPVTTPRQKVDKTQAFGGNNISVELVGDTFDEANQHAKAFCSQKNAIYVPPFDHEQIITGQATVGAEIEGQLPGGNAPDLLIMPVGGGGLAAGLTSYFSQSMDDNQFIFVEPDGAPSLQRSLITGKRAILNQVDSFVDGAAVAQIGALNFDKLGHFNPNQVVLSPTNGLCETMIEMLNVEGVVLEPAGALAIDTLKRLPRDRIEGKTIVCIVSGGNFDFERLPDVKERALKFSGLKKYLILQMPQRPGALKDFLYMLGPDDDITRFEYLKKSARNFGSVLLGIETKAPENFGVLFDKITDAGMRYQDITENDIIASLVV